MSDPTRVVFSTSAYCYHDGAILLVQHKLHGWVPPGGEVEVNETPRQAVVRELHEELGWRLDEHYQFGLANNLTCGPSEILDYDEHPAGPKGLHCNFSFLVAAATRVIRPCDKFAGYGWFTPNTIVQSLKNNGVHLARVFGLFGSAGGSAHDR